MSAEDIASGADSALALHGASPEAAMAHLGKVLVLLADLTPGDRCRALDAAFAFYNDQNPHALVEPVGCGYTMLVNVFPFDERYDPSMVPTGSTTGGRG